MAVVIVVVCAAADNITRTATGCVRDTVSHSWVTCNAAPGVGTLHHWSVSVASQSSGQSTGTTSYLSPSLLSLSGVGSTNANTNGGQTVFLNGYELGPVSSSVSYVNDGLVSVVYGPTVSVLVLLLTLCCGVYIVVVAVCHEVLLCCVFVQSSPNAYSASGCTVVSASLGSVSQMSCVTGVGVGSGLAWSLVLGGQTASLPNGAVTSSYGRPIISSFSGVGSSNALTVGNQVCDALYLSVFKAAGYC